MRRRSLHSVDELAAAGLVDEERRAALERVAGRFAIAITPEVAELAEGVDAADPIRRQFVPDERELEFAPEERADPIGDDSHAPVPGIVHRYPDRVLLKPSHACAVYCRFCFRREMVGPDGAPLSADELARAFDYIRAHEEIWEVVVTGGDPLLLSPRRVAEIVAALEAIPHVAVIRFHSRIPIVDPARIDDAMLRALASEKAVYVVVHANHVRELTPAVRAACARIVGAGIPTLAQTVLLAGVNDDAATLEALLRALVAMRVKPYYLHHPDLAPGTGHFRLPIEKGQDLVRRLRGRVSGLCQPTYVLDIPGGHGKVPIGPGYLERDEAGGWSVEDIDGERHDYPPREG